MSKTSRMNKERAEKQKAQAKDTQTPMTGKSENDFNKQGNKQPTQKNEGNRTPESRHDRESHVGSQNQAQSRQGAPSSGEGRNTGNA